MSSEFRVSIIGLGHIGSQLTPLLARMNVQLVLVDPDRYEPGNLAGQNISHSDVDLSKVTAMARLGRSIRSDIDIQTWPQAVEDVPMGRLRSDVLVSCVDSRSARQKINTIAWRLGIPWVDTAVNADGLLARVAVYVPGATASCLECRWSEDDYRLLEAVHGCAGSLPASTPAATNAPVELGGLVAAHCAHEVRRLLKGDRSHAGQERFINLEQGEMFSARIDRNPHCRFDHGNQVLNALAIDEQTPLAALLDETGYTHVSLEHHQFVHSAACSTCFSTVPMQPSLDRQLLLNPCPACGRGRNALRLTDALALDLAVGLKVADIGLRGGDVITLENAEERILVEVGK